MRRFFIAAALLSIILLASASSTMASASPVLQPVSEGATGVKQESSYTLSFAVPAYYVQESGDVILFIFLAVDSAGVKAAFTFGNGTTGWHFSGAPWAQELFNPQASMSVESEGYIVVAALLLKNVWPSGWRVVDQCFGMVPSFNKDTSMTAVTFNQDFRMILIYNVNAA